jgi:hypothetical protein
VILGLVCLSSAGAAFVCSLLASPWVPINREPFVYHLSSSYFVDLSIAIVGPLRVSSSRLILLFDVPVVFLLHIFSYTGSVGGVFECVVYFAGYFLPIMPHCCWSLGNM